jgi:MATE family multidrug resistance protein
VVVNITSFTYMIPMGISGAAAVLVGQAVGRNDPVEARQMGNASLVVSAAFMAASGLLLALLGGPICGLFSDDGRVVALGRALLLLVAVYQIADGLQGVAGGALRGLGDTRSAMVANLVGYWAVGLPLGWALCFPGQMGAVGFWLGITVGLFVLAAFVLGRWVQASRVPRDSLPD